MRSRVFTTISCRVPRAPGHDSSKTRPVTILKMLNQILMVGIRGKDSWSWVSKQVSIFQKSTHTSKPARSPNKSMRPNWLKLQYYMIIYSSIRTLSNCYIISFHMLARFCRLANISLATLYNIMELVEFE